MKYGFTLIELMIVVAIISILACVAVPSYSMYIDRAARSEASTILPAIAAKEIAHFNATNTYVATDNTHPPLAARGSRSVQTPVNAAAWQQLGYANNPNGGLFGGPVYYRYWVSSNPGDPNFTVHATRDTVSGTEDGRITNQNTRAIVFFDGTDNGAHAID